ncbi:hypothetical protein KVT40_006639 [Elsinoe batatas]|uniref:Maltose/galactoside acetyltransferase domain-containing protein n=1 Tax=Elsinoe batatas TaxID=2601811 RepID=A0A8K0KYE9_9PEZI|nr:hypothetical protein KVT40_006639 [Elsinoe batatas]
MSMRNSPPAAIPAEEKEMRPGPSTASASTAGQSSSAALPSPPSETGSDQTARPEKRKSANSIQPVVLEPPAIEPLPRRASRLPRQRGPRLQQANVLPEAPERPRLLDFARAAGNVPILQSQMGPGDEGEQRRRMIRGLPYQHYSDYELLHDRESCRTAVEAFNEATRLSAGISAKERGRLFQAILVPELRRRATARQALPTGSIGNGSCLEGRFDCEFGYNVHIGEDVVVGYNCWMQDAATISIGARSIIGPNVKFYTVDISSNPAFRSGTRTMATASPIVVEEDCFIGADVTVLPGRTIRRGATIGAGTIVTQNVPSKCVVRVALIQRQPQGRGFEPLLRLN